MSKAFGGEREKERRELILSAAAACVAEEGIEGATLKKVAARAKVSTGMIAYYFKDKNHLMIETFRNRAGGFRKRLAEQAGYEPDLQRLRKVFELSFQQGDTTVWPFWLQFSAQASREPELMPQHLERIATVRDDLRRCVAQALATNNIGAPFEPNLVGDLFLVLYYGLGALAAAGGDVMPRERVEKLLELAIESHLTGS